LDTAGHDNVLGIMVGVLIMTLFIIAERLGHFIEEPMSNTPFDLPMNRFCAGITADLLDSGHPLARPRDREDAVIWM
jgi:putative membrane protein